MQRLEDQSGGDQGTWIEGESGKGTSSFIGVNSMKGLEKSEDESMVSLAPQGLSVSDDDSYDWNDGAYVGVVR